MPTGRAHLGHVAKWCGESAIYFKKMKFDVKWLLVPNGDIHIKME